MVKKICYLIGANDPIISFSPTANDLVIAVDGGYKELVAANITADIVIGDFDSLEKIPIHPHVIQLPCEKDQTDMEAAIQIGIERDYDTFYLYGASNGRLSHTIANIQLLIKLALLDKRGYMISEEEMITVIQDDTIELESQEGYLSVFSLSSTAKVSEENVKYPLNDYLLKNYIPLGVSNKFKNGSARIKVEDGIILIILER